MVCVYSFVCVGMCFECLCVLSMNILDMYAQLHAYTCVCIVGLYVMLVSVFRINHLCEPTSHTHHHQHQINLFS